MKVKVNKDLCIGCGACIAICPEVFEFDNEGKSEVKAEIVPVEFEDSAREAIDSCPTSAIEEE